MKFGDRGQDVKEAQKFLIDTGFLTVQEGFYSVRTEKAVRDLQNYLEVSPTGEYEESLKTLYYMKVKPRMRVVSRAKTETGENTNNQDTEPEFDEVGESGNASNQAGFNESVVKKKQAIPCYVVNLITNDDSGSGVIYLPHIPEEFTYSKSNLWEETATKGRSEPFQGYSGSGSLTVDISVTISADYALEDIDTILNKLEALAYPRYSESGRIVPPKLFFRCATFKVEGVLESLNISRKLPIINGKYSLAEVSLSIIETNPTSISAIDVQKGKK